MAAYTGNVVVLAGASRGIGEQIAYQLASQGAKLVLSARSAERLEEVAAVCRIDGAEVITIPADVTKESDCKALIDQAGAHYGRIDTLLFNAGGGKGSRFETRADLASAHAEMDLNYFGLVQCVQHALPHLKQTRGRIVGVSSVGGVIGLPGTSTYNAAKHAMRGFLQSLRVELRSAGVSVTIVYLGAVRTENFLRDLGDKAKNVPSVSTEEAAKSIIDAGARRGRDVIPSIEGKLVAALYPIMPGVIDAQLEKQVADLYGD